MAIIEFEGSLGVAKIRQLIGDFDKNQSGDAAELVLHFQPRSFIEAGALAQLTSWLLQKSQNGYSIKLAGDNDVVRYLGRMGVQAALGLQEPEINKLPENGRFIPLMLVNDGTDVFNAVSSIADIVLQQFDGVGAFLDAFEWSVNEIVDNVFIHAQSSTPGVVCAQLYPTKKRLDIAVCDSGVGIKETLSQSHDLKSHSEALEKALQRGVTRDVAVGQGNGMAGSMTILKKNGGKLLVWSGDALFRMEGGEEKGTEIGSDLPGTGVLLSFDLGHPVKLIDTWIGEPSWSYIDAEAERVAESGIKIAETCSHTASRPPATRLRRKITTLLPEIDGSLELDFEGVNSLSSSFLDELLGRLNAELGNHRFNEKIIVSGLSELHQNMANNVIGQRLALSDEALSPNRRVGDQNFAWAIIPESETTDASFHSLSLKGAPELFMAIRPGNWCIACNSTGHVEAVARVFRTRPQIDHTEIYFDKLQVINDDRRLEEFGFEGKITSNAMRLVWESFVQTTEVLIGDKLDSITLIDDAVHVRDLLELAVRDDLLGPALGPNELVKDMSVRARYLLGKLAPRNPIMEADTHVEGGSTSSDEDGLEELVEASSHQPGAGFAQASGGGDTNEDDQDELDTSNNQSLVPASLGLTFCVSESVSSLDANISWGKYERVPNDDHDITKTRTNRQSGIEEEIKVKLWQRYPKGGVVKVELEEGQLKPLIPDPAEPDVRLQGAIRANNNGEKLVTLFLVNGQSEPEENRDEAWVFQPEIVLTNESSGPGIFLRRPNADAIADDEELARLKLTYRNRLEFAVGHGVSVHAERHAGVADRAKSLRTEVLPRYEVAATETPGMNQFDRDAMKTIQNNVWMDMRSLAEMDASQLETVFETLLADYLSWILEQKHRAEGEIKGFDDAAKKILSDCERISTRLREGLDVLLTDADALEAFRFANRAMADQRTRSIYSKQRRQGLETSLHEIDVPKNRSWRPFQLAFLLLSIPSLANPEHTDRSNPLEAHADLLWFPTGGGKTEAYLGVASFAMAIRRLSANLGGYDGSRGLTVIMRYTLRLLTLQQFQRGTTLLCAMELLRRADERKWGTEPFTLGLWVGNSLTPGDTKTSKEVIASLRNGNRGHLGKGSPHQLSSCAWCGSEIKPERNIVADEKKKQTAIYCGDERGSCEFSLARSQSAKHPGLPVKVVDEEIYHRPPTMVIATVDKFARMSWNPAVRTLFGRATQECERHGLLWPGHDCGQRHVASGGLPAAQVIEVAEIRPPDLIIQDEFHLISGPLGTMVGLYETAVADLSTWQLNGKSITPKIVASTATVRKAEAQVRNVFMRRLAIFPPSGLDVEDNFFSIQRPLDQKFGRRYMGICAPGNSRPAVLIRVYSAFLMAGQALFNVFGQVVDPYMSVVGYFNSLRELGGMRRLAEDDVKTRSFRVEMSMVERPGLAQRSMQGDIRELTSRVSSQDIGRSLNELEFPFVAEWNDEKGKWQSKSKPGQKPIDLVLATNMLSVGVDVDRLGLMVVNGQPKGAAEYIQATSRVGRSHPGLVATVLTWSRPRDLSHYETFEHYHDTFYQHVEAQSVTPFSPRAIDRGLTGLAISILRLKHFELAPNLGASTMDSPSKPELAETISAITSRCWDVTDDKEKRDLVERAMLDRADDWSNKVSDRNRDLVYSKYGSKPTEVNLLQEPGSQAWARWTVPTSMREVEPGVSMVLRGGDLDEGPSWQPRKTDGNGEDVG